MSLTLLHATIKLAFVAICALATAVCIQDQRCRRSKAPDRAVPRWHINTKRAGRVQRAAKGDMR